MKSPLRFPSTRQRSRRRNRRRANAAIELVLILPILLIMALGMIQFGIFFMNMQLLASASRVGAIAASEAPSLPAVNGGSIPNSVLDPIEQQLQSSGMIHCQVRLEHNVSGSQVSLVNSAPGACECQPIDNLTTPLPPGKYVRVTVCAPLSELMPNSLGYFGYDISGAENTAHSTSVFRYEYSP